MITIIQKDSISVYNHLYMSVTLMCGNGEESVDCIKSDAETVIYWNKDRQIVFKIFNYIKKQIIKGKRNINLNKIIEKHEQNTN